MDLHTRALAVARVTKVGGAGDGGVSVGDGDGGGGGRTRKKTQGRRKLVMRRIEDENHLQVRFSKRKKGLFKKAQELAVRCGAQVLAVVFSPAGRPFSYGYPVVADRFLSPSARDAEAAAAATLRVKADWDELQRQARDREEELRWRADLGKAPLGAGGVWSDADVLRWDLPRLEAVLAGLERIQAEAEARAHEMIIGEESAMMMQMQLAGGSSLLHCYGSGSHQVAMDTSMKLQTMSSGSGSLCHYLGPAGPFFTADSAGSSHQMAMDTTAMKLHMSIPAAGNNLFHHLGPACPFTATQYEGTAMDSTTMSLMMGGDVCHALAPMMPPGPPLTLPFNQGDVVGDHHGHAYYVDQDDGDGDYRGHGHGHVDGLYEMEGVYGTTCNYFG